MVHRVLTLTELTLCYLSVHRKRLKIHQETDKNIRQVIYTVLEIKQKIQDRVVTSKWWVRYRSGLWRQIHSLVIGDDGLLFKQTTSLNESGTKFCAVIPESLITTVLYHLHGAPLASHTITNARKKCYWLHVTEDIKEFCSTCKTCQQQSMPVPSHKVPLLPIQPQRRGISQSILPKCLFLPQEISICLLLLLIYSQNI